MLVINRLPLTLTLSLITISCASEPIIHSTSNLAHEQPAPYPPAKDGEKCEDSLEQPGANQDAPQGYEFEIAYADGVAETDKNKALEHARAVLQKRICQRADCSSIARRIQLWRAHTTSRGTCVMVVLNRRFINEFLTTPIDRFKQSLSGQVGQLHAPHTARLKVALASIKDRGVPGGELAEWIYPLMLNALASQGYFELVKLPQEWGGGALPPGIDLLIEGQIHEIPMRDGSPATLELSWIARDTQSKLSAPTSITFPQEIAPTLSSKTKLTTPRYPTATRRLPLATMHISGRPTGGICVGSAAPIYIQTQQPTHIRIFNISGDGELGLGIFTTQNSVHHPAYHSLGKVRAIPTTAIETEEFFVISAPREDDLGPFRSMDAPCRLSPEWISKLRDNKVQLSPHATIYHTGFRLMRSSDYCPAENDKDSTRAQIKSKIMELPLCDIQ